MRRVVRPMLVSLLAPGARGAGWCAMRARRIAALAAGAVLALASALSAHDLFIKLDTFFLSPGATVRVPVLNGTFTKSENAIERRRIADLSLVTPGGREPLDTGSVSAQGDTTLLSLRLRGPGTYVVALSTRPSEIALAGKQFTAYLQDEAIRDVLEARARAGISADSAHERYSKHVKAVFQVGAARTDGFSTPLGYAAEIVPLDNPYALGPGGTLRLRCLVDGRPAVGLSVLAGGRTPAGARMGVQELRTDVDGVAALKLTTRGRWYAKFVRMEKVQDGPHDYESRWATLTFEVR
jgi:hypothetical protein